MLAASIPAVAEATTAQVEAPRLQSACLFTIPLREIEAAKDKR